MKYFIVCLWVNFIYVSVAAQQTHDISGIWEGKLHTSVDIRIVFHISRDSSGHWAATMDSPDQNIKGIPCSTVSLMADSVSIQIPSVRGKYLGLIVTDSSIRGKWVQGLQLDLPLKKVDKITGLVRPQTPRPPFPYANEEVEYDNPEKTVHYGATITTPAGTGPFPAVVLITGSGAQDRDETIFEHRPFAVIADYLTRRGVIVMRVDDRGMGKSTGSFSESTSLDFAKDVSNSLDFLKTRSKVDAKKLGLIGHSEGGMIAPIVADQRKDIDFIILLAGPGEKIDTLMAEQSAAVLLSVGISKDAVQSFRRFYPAISEAIVHAKSKEEASANLDKSLDEWIRNTPKNYVLATAGIYDDSSRKKFVQTMVGSLYSPWFIYFLQFDPKPWLEQLKCKVLALNGEKDLQVIAASNLAGIRKALQKSQSKEFEVQEIPGLNHLFQTCHKCTVQEYGQLEETFSPAALQIMGDWIDKYVK